MDVCSLPFNRFLGLQQGGVGLDSFVSLMPEANHLNHVGTIHASVLFAIGEASAGLALVSHLGGGAKSLMPVLRSAQTKYRRPGQPGQLLRGQGVIAESVAAVQAELESRRRVLIDIRVTVEQAGQEVFRGTYVFFAALPPVAV